MKQMFTLLFALLLPFYPAMAQTKTAVNGKVKDAAGAPVFAVNVFILNVADSSLAKAGLTENDGTFSVELPAGGTYLVKLSTVGYDAYLSAPLNINAGETKNLPDILLKTSNNQLKDVTVVSKKPLVEVKADKVVFNVENSINATGSNAMELLQKSPGVTVDNNDNISMKGKTGVKVYIDGRMTQLDPKELAAFLRNINSNDIEAIEMISNPSARYDASGNAGIVNIRLKKNRKYGTNGSVNMGYVQGYYPGINGSVNLNYRNSKINVFGNIGGEQSKRQNGMSFDRVQKDTTYIERNTNFNWQRNVNMKAGIDYFANAKNTFGLLFTTNVGND
ncbi:MAG: TonB-dependent receptor, partial [Chitinophagia bacterium]|nr:TonB-dependent receptor [Chitinophagia bacterium]